MDVVVEEFSREIKGMGSLEPRLRPKVPELVSAQLQKKSKRKAGTSKIEDVQKDLDKLIKIEKRLLSFYGPLLHFLYSLIKPMKREKFFMDEMKVRLDIVDMFYVAKLHSDESYAIVEGKKVHLQREKRVVRFF